MAKKQSTKKVVKKQPVKKTAPKSTAQRPTGRSTRDLRGITRLYHLTPEVNAKAIQAQGIKANGEGMIFAYVDQIVQNTIARDQVRTERYAVFVIALEGITGKVMADNVAELAACCHRIIVQQRIDPKFIKLEGVFDTIVDRPTEYDYQVNAKLYGATRAQVDQYFKGSIARHQAFCEAQEQGMSDKECQKHMKKVVKEAGGMGFL